MTNSLGLLKGYRMPERIRLTMGGESVNAE